MNWLPWGREAFDRSAREGKPVLLSISAVWCHWCHVMDETTYSDREVIDLVNSLYVPVRVDNDRNPDINRRYNQGGWPTTAFLSPRGALLAGTTYLPPDTMRKVLRRISELYAENRDRLEAAAVETIPGPRRHGALDESLVDAVASSLLDAWDREHGGLGWEPKFPHPDALLLALRMHSRGGGEYLDFAVHYLKSMAGGGLRDTVEGGFFHHSVPGLGYFAAPFALALDLFLEGPLAVRWEGGDEDRRRLLLAITALSPDSRILCLPHPGERWR
ncbi:MAG: thioredoxin domain-containing protein [Actinobacteria bacterium]|nr:thioredoxin domain-containing protein [Actinomycetota bacterium]